MFPGLVLLLATLQSPDTALRVRGFVQEVATRQGDSTGIQMVLAYPLTVAGTRVRALSLPGDRKRWVR